MRPPLRFIVFACRGLLKLLLVHSFVAISASTVLAEESIEGQTLAYAGKADSEQTLDLFLAASKQGASPLAVIVLGDYWRISELDRSQGEALAGYLQRQGISAALVRYRPSPQHAHPAQVGDVSTAVAFLAENSRRFGFDQRRMFLLGHGGGGHIVSLLGVRPNYLDEVGFDRGKLAGVITLSGTYDLGAKEVRFERLRNAYEQTFGGDSAQRAEASPVRQPSSTGPPILIVSPDQDISGFKDDSWSFLSALDSVDYKNAEYIIVPGRDHRSILDMDDTANLFRSVLVAYLKGQALEPELEQRLLELHSIQDPRRTEVFWQRPDLVHSFPTEERFFSALRRYLRRLKRPGLEPLYAAREYHAIDLLDYLDSLPADRVGSGDHLVINNLRNERLYWHRNEIEKHRPVIVIGIDEQRNLYRYRAYYRLQMEYSWKPALSQPPMMARPLGAWIYFPNGPAPEGMLNNAHAHYTLTGDSFRWEKDDPLADLLDLQSDVFEVLVHKNACVSCHRFRGVGPRSHSLRANTLAPHGGYGLPLTAYPQAVWWAFIYEQGAVAKKIGRMPQVIEPAAAEKLFRLVVEERGLQR